MSSQKDNYNARLPLFMALGALLLTGNSAQGQQQHITSKRSFG